MAWGMVHISRLSRSLACMPLLLAPGAACAMEGEPAEELVQAFFLAADQDEQAASAMLASDAAIGMGHVGFPLDAGFVREINEMCNLMEVVTVSGRSADLPPDTVPVEARYTCDRPEGRDSNMTVTYFVADGHILAANAAFADDAMGEDQ